MSASGANDGDDVADATAVIALSLHLRERRNLMADHVLAIEEAFLAAGLSTHISIDLTPFLPESTTTADVDGNAPMLEWARTPPSKTKPAVEKSRWGFRVRYPHAETQPFANAQQRVQVAVARALPTFCEEVSAKMGMLIKEIDEALATLDSVMPMAQAIRTRKELHARATAGVPPTEAP